MLFFIAKATDLSRQTVTKHPLCRTQCRIFLGNRKAESLLVIDFQPFLS